MSASSASEAAFCALIIALSCSVAAAQGTAPPPAVSVTPVVSREVTETIDYIGRLTAVDRVDVVARVVGWTEFDERLIDHCVNLAGPTAADRPPRCSGNCGGQGNYFDAK